VGCDVGVLEHDEPRDAQEQDDASACGEAQAELAGEAAPLGRELPRHDGDEDDVVDAEDDLQRSERDERGDRRDGEEFHHGGRVYRWRAGAVAGCYATDAPRASGASVRLMMV